VDIRRRKIDIKTLNTGKHNQPKVGYKEVDGTLPFPLKNIN
jgi:hypothetical protein